MAIPNMRHVVSQSVSIFGGGKKVGSAQSLSPTENLSTQLIRELDSDVAGEIIEIAIGVPTFGCTLSRYKTYQQNMFQALGYTVQNIGDIVDPLDLQTVFKSGLTGNTIAKTFMDSVIKSMADPVAIGTILVTESASFDVRTIV